MIRSPHILVRTLLEAGEGDLPPGNEVPEETPGDDFDPQEYALTHADITWPGEPVTGFHQRLTELLASIRTKKRMVEVMGRNTILHRTGNDMAIRFHQTDIITVTPEDVVTVNTNGYHTLTTGERLDAHLPGRWSTYRRYSKSRGFHGIHDEQLYWSNRSHPFSREGMLIEVPLTDGDTILADGTLRAQAKPIYKKKRAVFHQGGKWFNDHEGRYNDQGQGNY
jgi:hypothetical protein